MGSGWIHISPICELYPCFKIEENSNSYTNKAEKIGQNGDEFGRVTANISFIVMSTLDFMNHEASLYIFIVSIYFYP